MSQAAPPLNAPQRSDNPEFISNLRTYHLDWLSPKDIAALPAAERPTLRGLCRGAYLPPKGNLHSNAIEPGNEPVTATAARFETTAKGALKLIGNVVLEQGNRLLTSEQIFIDQSTRETSLEGKVKIRQQGMLLAGDRAKLNLNKKNLSITDAEYVVYKNHIHGQASHIYNENTDVLVFEDSTYTTCEPNSNAWQFSAGSIRLNRSSGWGTAKDAIVRVKGVPIFYFPWMMFPLDDRRQSGFLFPIFSSSTQNGFEMALPYYFNLAPNYDATLTPRYISKRGPQLEAEFRYLTDYGKGEVGLAYLGEDKLFSQRSRHLTLWRNNGFFSGDWYSKVDYTRVSDENYFNDLSTSLDAMSQTHLNQMAEIGLLKPNLHAALKLERYQTLDKLLADNELPFRKTPQLELHVHRGEASGFYVNWISNATRFKHPLKSFAGVTEATRLILAPSVEYRYRRPWTQITPKLRFIYGNFNFSGSSPLYDLQETESLYSLSVDSRLFFERNLSLASGSHTQTLEPRLFYLYTPFHRQSHRQLFDTSRYSFDYDQLFRENRFTGYDRFGDAKQVSLGLTSRLIDNQSGMERFRLQVGQSFYFADRRVQLYGDQAIETAHQSALVADGRLWLNDRWQLRADTQWDSVRNNIDRGGFGIHYQSGSQTLLNISYRYLDSGASTNEVDNIKQTDISFARQINRNWSLMGRWAYNLELHRSFENLLGIEYDSCCYRVRLVNRRYLKESSLNPLGIEAERGIFLQFQLKGLGGVGNQINNLLNESIPGFAERERLIKARGF